MVVSVKFQIQKSSTVTDKVKKNKEALFYMFNNNMAFYLMRTANEWNVRRRKLYQVVDISEFRIHKRKQERKKRRSGKKKERKKERNDEVGNRKKKERNQQKKKKKKKIKTKFFKTIFLPKLRISVWEIINWPVLIHYHQPKSEMPNTLSGGLGLVGFYGTSTIVGYLMPNHLYTYILNTYDFVWFGFMVYQTF